MDEFVAEVDEAIRDRKVPPTSKTPELIQTIAKHKAQQSTITRNAVMFTGQLLRITDQYTTTITCLMVTCIVLHEFLLLFHFLKEDIKCSL